MSFLKNELNLFFLALGFFSRIPMPGWIDYSTENLNRSSRYFTLVGWVLGIFVAVIFYTAHRIFSVDISLWLAMCFSLLLTGAFHEDGLADTADGLGGGFTREKKLTIMKDSRIGTYGAAALIMAIMGKYLLLRENPHIELSVMIAYALSRATAASLLFDMHYVADVDSSKSKPLANNQSRIDLLIVLTSATPLFIVMDPVNALMLCSALIIFRFIAKYFFNKQLGGYTGDCLGAAQQISELFIYAFIYVVIYSFTQSSL